MYRRCVMYLFNIDSKGSADIFHVAKISFQCIEYVMQLIQGHTINAIKYCSHVMLPPFQANWCN